MTDNSLFAQAEDILINAVFPVCLPVRELVLTMDKTVVYVICVQFPELSVNRTLDCIEVKRPAVGSVGVIRTEVYLIKDILSDISECFTVYRKARSVSRREVVVVDAALVSVLQRLDSLRHTCLEHICRAKSYFAYLIACSTSLIQML